MTMTKLLSPALALLLAIPVGIAYGQPDPALNVLDELALGRELLNDMQDTLGPMDTRLIEPIEQLADNLMMLNQFDEAHDLLDRAMQIARIEDGLYTDIQRPLLSKKIGNFANRGNWEAARENMEHLYWLYTEKSKFIDQELIDDLLELSRFHLRALAEDDSFYQGYHFSRSAEIRWIAIAVAQTLWSENDARLAPMIYEQLRQLHLQTVALWNGGPASYQLRKVGPGLEAMRGRYDVNETFYLSGLGLLNRLYEVYAGGESPDAEALAMTNVYLGDWHILYDKPEAATKIYRQAYKEMLATGVDESLVNELWDQPIVIPDTKFYSTVEAAVVAQRTKLVTLEGEAPYVYISFSEWSAALPNVRSPLFSDAGNSQESNSNFALFSFSLAGVNTVSRSFSHRYSSTVNMIEQAELLAHYLESPPEEGLLLAKFNSLTFRPRLVDGEPRQATGRLKYYLARDTVK